MRKYMGISKKVNKTHIKYFQSEILI